MLALTSNAILALEMNEYRWRGVWRYMEPGRGLGGWLAIFLLSTVGGIAGQGHRAPRPDEPTMLLPGSRLLIPPPLRDSTARLTVYIKRANGDTAERKMADVVRAQRDLPGQRGDLVLTSVWGPPYASNDTVVIERRGLAPVSEQLTYNGAALAYHYSHRHVWGTVQHKDSAARSFDQQFPEDLFAFSEVDLLVRSLPFRQGLQVVVPLFSENDALEEHDTLTVIGPDSANRSADGWVVRFADPAIVAHYVVSARSREILSDEVLQRRTGSRLRYVLKP